METFYTVEKKRNIYLLKRSRSSIEINGHSRPAAFASSPSVTFFVPAALGASVNFKNCFATNPERRVNVTSLKINPYSFSLGGAGGTFTLTANANFNIRAENMELTTFSKPFMMNLVRKTYSLCNVTACSVTPGPVVFFLPIFIPKSHSILTPQSEYFAAIKMSESRTNQIMCVSFEYPIINWT
ncbi:unnamed protein product [Eruca vesicaria subsp. sativa]|uniref:Uncharacterized protein n=1 Tax=Eruca vesicaria subsp. sativa TaxID=29727 RepID=A0ABC8L4E6_ERUVS|nr:unnamed protein product [Eruca vesicaria subsp. sativa]